MSQWNDRDVLVVSPSPCFPLDHGNRLRIYRICQRLMDYGARIHFVLYPAEADWRKRLPTAVMRTKADLFASFHIATPTRPLHEGAIGSHHACDEWWDPSIGQYLEWLCKIQRFDAAIVNYTWLSKAFAFLPEDCLKVLDTHDRFSGRKELFIQNGLSPEFFYLTEEEEAKALQRADVVWAIKREEETFFRQITDRSVFTVAHIDPLRRLGATPADFLRVGLIGANNNINRSNFDRFIDDAIAHVRQTLCQFELVVAGSVCKSLTPRSEGFIRTLGYVDDVASFYEQVDVVIVPMTFSTGLKIKTAEALSYGKPLISLDHAFEGFYPTHPYHQLHDNAGILDAIAEIARNPGMLAQLAEASEASIAFSDAEIQASLIATAACFDRPREAAFWIVIAAEDVIALPLLLDHVCEVGDYIRNLLPIGFFVVGRGKLPESAVHRLLSLARVVVEKGPDGGPTMADPVAGVSFASRGAVLEHAFGFWVTCAEELRLADQTRPGSVIVSTDAVALSHFARTGHVLKIAQAFQGIAADVTLCASRLDADLLHTIAASDHEVVLLPFLRYGSHSVHLRTIATIPGERAADWNAPQTPQNGGALPEGGKYRLADMIAVQAVFGSSTGPGLSRMVRLGPAQVYPLFVELALRNGSDVTQGTSALLSQDDLWGAVANDSGWTRIWAIVAALKSQTSDPAPADLPQTAAPSATEPAQTSPPETVAAPSMLQLGFTRLGPDDQQPASDCYFERLLIYAPLLQGAKAIDCAFSNLVAGTRTVARVTLRFFMDSSGVHLVIRRNDCSEHAFSSPDSIWLNDVWGDFIKYHLVGGLSPYAPPHGLTGEDAKLLRDCLNALIQCEPQLNQSGYSTLLGEWKTVADVLRSLDISD